MFPKHSPSEIFMPQFWEEGYLFKLQFSDLMVRPNYTRKGLIDVIHSRAFECSLCGSGLFSRQHGSFELSDSQTRVLHN